MAHPEKFPEATDIATSASHKPGVLALPILDHGSSTTSCWQLSKEELKEITETGVVWITTDKIKGKLQGSSEEVLIQPTIRVNGLKSQGLAPL